MSTDPSSILIIGETPPAGRKGLEGDILRHAGFDAVIDVPADIGPSALTDMCHRQSPGLVLLTGGATGRLEELADAVRDAGLSIPPALVAVLDHGEGALRVPALEAGIGDVLVRPFPPAELVIRVGNHLRQQQTLAAVTLRAQALEDQLEDRTQRLQEAVDVLRAAERRLNEQLAASRAESRGKSELMATAAHELRTPLHAIIGFTDLLRTESYGPLGDPRYVEYAHDIHHAATQLAALVDGTLDLTKAESGLEALDIRRVDLSRVVQDSVRMLNQMAAAGGVRLEVIVPDAPLMIRTDPEKVRQVVINLASNAVKFTPHGGRVTVEVATDAADGALIMIVRDTGIGIAAQDIPTAMKPFGQVRQPDRPHPKGTGLGLPLTRQFVEMLGGQLSIASQPGRGTIVTVKLPADIPANQEMADRRSSGAVDRRNMAAALRS